LGNVCNVHVFGKFSTQYVYSNVHTVFLYCLLNNVYFSQVCFVLYILTWCKPAVFSCYWSNKLAEFAAKVVCIAGNWTAPSYISSVREHSSWCDYVMSAQQSTAGGRSLCCEFSYHSPYSCTSIIIFQNQINSI